MGVGQEEVLPPRESDKNWSGCDLAWISALQPSLELSVGVCEDAGESRRGFITGMKDRQTVPGT